MNKIRKHIYNVLFLKYLLFVLTCLSCVPTLEKTPTHQFVESRLISCLADTNSCNSQSNTSTISTPTTPTPALTTPPSSLSYSPASYTFTVNVAMSSSNPTVIGTVSSYSISPSLPTGISINTTTGVISGTPIGASGAIAYTITATNALGNTTAIVNIDILTYKRIFVTAVGSKPGTDFTSAVTADARCNIDANKPATGYYKAMLVDSNRRATITPNAGDGQLDWIFGANITYARPGGAIIQFSNANSLFTFPLVNSPTAGGAQYFTGMNADWTTNPGGNCSNWTDGTSIAAGSGVSARGEFNTNAILDGAASVTCGLSGTGQQLLCVEQ